MYLSDNLSKKTKDIIAEHPAFWESKLFCQVLSDEIDSNKFLYWDLENGLEFENTTCLIGLDDVKQWVSKKLENLEEISRNVTRLMQCLNIELNKKEELKNDRKIIYLAKRIGEQYRRSIEWAIEYNGLSVDKKFLNFVDLSSQFSETFINDIEQFCTSFKAKVDELSKKAKQDIKSSKSASLEIKFELTVPQMEEFNKELKRLIEIYG